jgi:hypothetical protein
MSNTILPSGLPPTDRDSQAEPSIRAAGDLVILSGLDRLATQTRRRRERGDSRVIGARQGWQDHLDRMRRRREALTHALGRERDARAVLERSPATGPAMDQGRRGLSTTWYTAILVLLWVVNVPVAIPTFQILEEPLFLTVVLALFADTILLLAAHAAGVTLRRADLACGGRSALGREPLLGWALFGVGVAAACAQAWARWRYLTLTTGGNLGVIALTTVLMLATFFIAEWAAWRHHHPHAAEAAACRRQVGRRRRRSAHAERGVNAAAARFQRASGRRRHLAQIVVGRANQILAQALSGADPGSVGTTASIDEPDWLVAERALAKPAAVSVPLQPTAVDTPAPGIPSVSVSGLEGLDVAG